MKASKTIKQIMPIPSGYRATYWDTDNNEYLYEPVEAWALVEEDGFTFVQALVRDSDLAGYLAFEDCHNFVGILRPGEMPDQVPLIKYRVDELKLESKRGK